MNIRPYYSEGGPSAAFYDVVTAADADLAGDIDIYAALAPAGGSILELGSGTGRVSEALAQRGFDVTGLELSPAMLNQATARIPSGVRLAYEQGDMRSFDFGRTFDAVICPFYALAHLPPGEDWDRVLAAVSRHLTAGGRAAFHMPIAAKMAEPPPPPGAVVVRSGALSVLMAGKMYDGRSGRMDLDLTYVLGPSSKTERYTLYSGDLPGAARKAGLRPAGAPAPLGGSGFVHTYRRAKA